MGRVFRWQRRSALAALVALLLSSQAFAEDDVTQGAPPADVRTRTAKLEFKVVDLVYSGGKASGAAADLVRKVEDLAIKETDTEIKIEISGDILFDFDKATLRPAATPVLERVAEVIRKQGKPMVRIEGHTDSKGNHPYNVKLSQRRADSVKDWLVKQAAIGGVLVTKGFAETKPLAPNQNPDGSDNPEGRQKNRRVEIVVKKM